MARVRRPRLRRRHEPLCAVPGGEGTTCPAGLPVPRGSVLTWGILRSVAVLALLGLLLTGANLWWTAREVHVAQAAQAREQATAQRAGQAVEAKLCRTLGRLAALQPPPGSATANPSRGYEQALHATLAELGPDIGCR